MILMATIGKPHGVRGLVKVNAFTKDAGALADYPLTDKSGRRFGLDWVTDGVAQLTEITPTGPRKIADRTAAERLTNTELFAPRAALPEAEPEEFYLADLIGLQARGATGAVIGSVAAIHDYGAGPSLEILSASPASGQLLIPFTRAAVPIVDIAAGYLTIHPPAEIS
jgi:16S rRNA processing protein RimM